MDKHVKSASGRSTDEPTQFAAVDDSRLLCARLPVPLRSKSVEKKVQELADREEIRDLTATYALCVAQGLSNAELFTDDGAYINYRVIGAALTERCQGREELNSFFIERNAGLAMPMIHNHLIDIVGDEASALCSIELRLTGQGESLIASGYYRDRLRREDGRWKFVIRESNFFHWAPLHEGWANSAS